MATKEQIKIDNDKVASELLKDPSLDAAALADRCGFSEQKVRRIIRQMEDGGSIFSHTASLYPRKMGRRTFLILFQRSFRMADDKLMQEMTDPKMLGEMESLGINAVVEDSHYLSGAFDWAILITVDEHADLLRFLELWRKYYGEYFNRVVQSEVMFTATRNSKLNPKLNEIMKILH